MKRFNLALPLVDKVEYVGECAVLNEHLQREVPAVRFKVYSGDCFYVVEKTIFDHWICGCKDHQHRKSMCKHIYAVILWLYLQRTEGQQKFEHEEKIDSAKKGKVLDIVQKRIESKKNQKGLDEFV